MGAAFEVYNQMGWGLTEDIYQECIEIELRNRGISFDAQVRLELFFKETRLTKFFVPDLLVSEEILIELKAVKEINKDHEKQLFNYLRITGKPVGYLKILGTPKNSNGNDLFFRRRRASSALLKQLKFQPFNLCMVLAQDERK